MIANFNNPMKSTASSSDLNLHDIFLGYESGDGILVESPLGDILQEDCRAEWEIDHSDADHPYLLLKRILPSKDSNEKVLECKKKIRSMYGKSENIRASWYTGEIVVYGCPQNLFGEFVSGEKKRITVKKGEVIGQKPLKFKEGNIRELAALRKETDQKISISLIGYNDGCWVYASDQRAQVLGLFVNDPLKSNNQPTIQIELSLLLYTDSVGVSTMHVLQPANLSSEEADLMAKLNKQVAKLPKWSFGWMETIDGKIFPGCYLKASYSKDKGWAFKDYAYES